MKKTKKVVKKSGFYEYVNNNFKDSWGYVKESKNYILLTFALFIVSGVLGYLLPDLFREQLTALIKELIEQTKGLGLFGMISFIITNNIKSSFFGLFLGIFFGIIPLGMVIVNGFLIGFVSNTAVSEAGITILWKLLPHGIFEIPAVIISIGLGIKLGLFLISYKKRIKGICACFISLVSFAFLISFLSVIISLIIGLKDPQNLQKYSSEIYSNELMSNPLFLTIYFLVIFLIWVLSIYIGLLIFSKKERKEIINRLIEYIKNSIKVFLLIVIPLLVVAGIIEGILIILTS
jgi:stage II sporulation protein M